MKSVFEEACAAMSLVQHMLFYCQSNKDVVALNVLNIYAVS